MILKPLRRDLVQFLNVHNLTKKWEKVKLLFEKDIRYPSLHTELLEPHWRGIYSFRIDKKYRAIFFITNNKGTAEVFAITTHYKK
ncbi:MAG: hypothetical protein ACUZ8O_08985 [Candidatus Anammoxibacter sp.]